MHELDKREILEHLQKSTAPSWYGDKAKHMNEVEFAEMLLLDGCFMLEFFYKMESEERKDDEFMKDKVKVTQTLIDMILIENQIRFDDLFEIFKLAFPTNIDDDCLRNKLIMLVKKSFVDVVPKLTPDNVILRENSEIEHLLQVVHSLCIPSNHKRYDDSVEIIQQINTATELEKDGVRFQKIGNVYAKYPERPYFKDVTTLFDIDFNKGIMKILCFKIEDFTEKFFRNMIAYEQHSNAPQYFSHFASFMDQLVNSAEDVSLLRRSGIIINLLGTDEVVAKMFNQLDQGIVVSTIFSGVYGKVNRHCNKARNIWWAILKRDYFYDPWKGISTVAGATVVVLGLIYTVLGIINTVNGAGS